MKGMYKNEVPISVLFEGVDTDIYYNKKIANMSENIKLELDKIPQDFNFLCVGHWLQGEFSHDRKDIGGLIYTFLNTFKNTDNAPGLIVKTSGATFSYIDRDDILTKIDKIKRSITADKLPNIHLLHGDLTDAEILQFCGNSHEVYNHPKIKAFVTFTKGEGWGRPLAEFCTSTPKPIIAPNWSGQTDFLLPNGSELLSGELKQVHASAVWKGIIIEQSKWFYVDYNYASNRMKDVFENYGKYTNRARIQHNHMNKNFTLEKMTEQFKIILDKYLPEFPKQLEFNMPKQGNQMNQFNLPTLKRV